MLLCLGLLYGVYFVAATVLGLLGRYLWTASPAFARFGLKHQLSIDGDLNVVSHDDTGTLAREFPTKAKVLPID